MCHLWYSEQQAERWYASGGKAPFYRLKDGKVVQVTNVTNTPDDHGCDFDDMQYLGEGTFSHAEPRERIPYGAH